MSWMFAGMVSILSQLMLLFSAAEHVVPSIFGHMEQLQPLHHMSECRSAFQDRLTLYPK